MTAMGYVASPIHVWQPLQVSFRHSSFGPQGFPHRWLEVPSSSTQRTKLRQTPWTSCGMSFRWPAPQAVWNKSDSGRPALSSVSAGGGGTKNVAQSQDPVFNSELPGGSFELRCMPTRY